MGFGKGEEMTLRDDYNRDGYVVCHDMVSQSMIQHVINEFGKISSCVEKNQATFISTLKAGAKLSSVYDLFRNLFITSFLKKLGLEIFIIYSPVIHQMGKIKITDGYNGTSAHQDWASTQGSLDCVTVWIALTDAGIGNFPLEVIPGSHLGGLRDGKVNGSVLEVEADDKEFVPIECKAGDVIFLSGFTVHRTGKGNGSSCRLSGHFGRSGSGRGRNLDGARGNERTQRPTRAAAARVRKLVANSFSCSGVGSIAPAGLRTSKTGKPYF